MRTEILAVVFLGVATLVSAQTVEVSGLPPAPVLLGETEDETSVAVRLESYEATVRIHGFLAETTILMSFFNSDSRELAGELVFALPEGATVSGYGLDVEGVMVDGVAVEKHKARIVFERESRKRVDPGLVEWLGGSLFRTRVYPILGESWRLIKVQYVSELQIDDGRASYTLPLAHLPSLERLKVEVEVHGAEMPPIVQSHPFTELSFVGEGKRHTLTVQSEEIRPAQDLELTSFFPSATTVMVDEYGNGEHAFAIANVLETDLVTRRRRSAPNRIAILWDASFSRVDSDHAAVIDLLESVLSQWRPREVLLTVFRDHPEEPKKFRLRRGRNQELLDSLASTPYDGATRWDTLGELDEFDADAIILVTDGRATLGASLLPASETPVFAVSASQMAEHRILQYLAESSGGFYANLAQLPASRVAEGFAYIPFTLLDVQVVEGGIDNISAPTGRPILGTTLVSGLLKGQHGKLRLEYGLDGRVMRAVDVTINGALGTGMVKRFWAQSQVDDLSVFLDENRAAILALGRQHGLVTPHTSLMVLETLDQYLEYRIEPPATLPEMRDEYLAKITSLEEEESETEAEHLDALVEQWAEFIHPPDKEPSSSHATEPSRVTEPRTTRQPSATEAASTIRAEADEETPHEAIEATIEQAFEAEVVVRASLIPRQDLEALSPRTVTVNDRDTPAIAGIVVQPWDPGMPYLDSLKATPEAEMYQTYLKLRSDFTSSPGFFVDCARFFLKCEQRDTGLRILSSLLDLEIEDPRMIRIVAMLYQEQGDIDAAIELLAQLTRLRPELPQTHRDLALAFAIRGLNSVDVDSGSAESDLERSVELLRQVVLGPWGSVPDHLKHMYGVDGRFEDLSRIALVDLFWVGMAYEKLFGERHGLAVELEAQFPGEIEADLRVVLTWDNDSADVDLWVIEPSGEKVYYGSPTSAAGGILSDDCMDGFGPESYTLRVAPSGTYRIVANYYSEDGPELVGPVTVQATVFTDFGRGTEKSEIRTIRLEDEKDEFEIAVINIE